MIGESLLMHSFPQNHHIAGVRGINTQHSTKPAMFVIALLSHP